MKRFLGILTLLIAFNASAAEESPLLVVDVGALAHNGLVTSCAIYHSHPALAGKVDQVRQWIKETNEQGKMEVTGVFIMAQIPSTEIYALYDDGKTATRVPLSTIYGNMQTRSGNAAKELLQIAKDICKSVL